MNRRQKGIEEKTRGNGVKIDRESGGRGGGKGIEGRRGLRRRQWGMKEMKLVEGRGGSGSDGKRGTGGDGRERE